MSLLYLVRHGQASAGAEDYDQLSETGREQSYLLGQWWLEHKFNPDSLHHGTLKRQRDTALSAVQSLDLGSSGVQCESHPGLNEYNHRVVESFFAHPTSDNAHESLTFDDYLGIMQRWRDHEPVNVQDNSKHPIEPYDVFMRRGWSTVQALCQQNDSGNRQIKRVFFTSGGVIASIVANILNLDFHHTIDVIWRIRNTSITTLHFDGRQARLIEFNTIPHLQTRHNPALITLI